MGRGDVVKHCSTQCHLDQAVAMKSQSKLSFSSPSIENLKRTEAEVRMAVLAASFNIPLAFHDHLSPLIRSVFPDSAIAAKYHSASTKATCMLNHAVAPLLKMGLIDNMKLNPFSIAVDGSNDTGLSKMNPLTVRIFDLERSRIVTRFLDMCTATASTAEALYSVVDGKLVELFGIENPWEYCTSVAVDNTSANIGIHNSLKSRVLQRNSAIFFSGCPCHMIHNAAQKAAVAFSSCVGFDIEEFTVDLYYWFEKSTKRKNCLRSYCEFCDQEYRSIIKNVSTRWLSLETAINRCLKQYPSLKSYFLSEDDAAARFQRLKKLFENPMTEIYLLFFQSILPTLNCANKFLQREEPLIHLLQPQLLSLVKKLLSKFVKPSILVKSLKDLDGLYALQCSDEVNQVANRDLVIGFITKQEVNKLLHNGDISERQHSSFHAGTRKFFNCVTSYLLKWCPLRDDLLINASWIDFDKRLNKTFSSVEYFISRYPSFFENLNMDLVNEQFLSYQIMSEEDIPHSLKDDPDGGACNVDKLWGYLKNLKRPGTNSFEFDLLFKVANVILTIPHSNAGEERIFSLINKNETPSRSSLSLDGTLSSLITVKTHIEEPLKWKPSEELLKKAKQSTAAYNQQHTT